MADDPKQVDAAAFDDLSYLAEVDAEFTALEAEIERISAMPRSQSEAKLLLLKQLREQWQAKADERTNQPLWRQKIDAAVGPALEKILEDSLMDDGAGNMTFNLSNHAMQEHGKPLLGAVIEGFRDMITEKVAKASPEERAKNPFMSALAVLVQQLPQDIGAVIAGTKVEPGGASVDGAVEADGQSLKAETEISTSFEGKFTPENTQQANVAGQALFQNLVQGLGQVLNTMGTKVTSSGAAKAPAPNAPQETKDVAADAGAKPAAAADEAPPKVKVNIDFAGLLGSLFKQATVKTNAGKTTVSARTVEAATPPPAADAPDTAKPAEAPPDDTP